MRPGTWHLYLTNTPIPLEQKQRKQEGSARDRTVKDTWRRCPTKFIPTNSQFVVTMITRDKIGCPLVFLKCQSAAQLEESDALVTLN